MKIAQLIHQSIQQLSKRLLLLLFLFTVVQYGNAESKKDTLVYKAGRDTVRLQKAQLITFDSGDSMLYFRPKPFQFAKNVPIDLYQLGKTTFSKKNLPALAAILIGTAALVAVDQPITNAAQQFGRYIHLNPDRKTIPIVKISGKSVLEFPANANSIFYFLGEGWPSLLIAGGFYSYGLTTNNYQALQTTSQLVETFFVLGITTQFLKRITGRESPWIAMDPITGSQVNGGNWHLFPNPKIYQKNVPQYDAFPSGHLATAMATITILSGNYPDNMYIKPVGYSLMGLLGFAMLNNGVHWASDYPLAIAIGYTCGKISLSHGRQIISKKLKDHGISSSFTPVYLGQGVVGASYRLTF